LLIGDTRNTVVVAAAARLKAVAAEKLTRLSRHAGEWMREY
jgi:hypothetical protein